MKNTIQIANSFFTPKIVYYPSKASRYARKLLYHNVSDNIYSEISNGITLVEQYVELVEELIDNEDFDLFWINIPYPDHFLHKASDKSV
ncbi:MAG: hypothetical protein ABWW65_03450, partial [Thermoprotei archaeon]